MVMPNSLSAVVERQCRMT